MSVTTDDVCFNRNAHISFENASIDANNPVEVVVALPASGTISLPMYLNQAAPMAKVRIRVIKSGDKNQLKSIEETSGIIESFGEGTLTLPDPVMEPVYSAFKPMDVGQAVCIPIQAPTTTKRSIQILLHSASFTDAVMDACLHQSAGGFLCAPVAITLPSVYCIIYALDKTGRKLTPKNSSFSTSVFALNQNQNQPIWNEQFDLFCRDIVRSFDSIRIKIKIHKSGVLKDRNLGMISLSPKDIFKDYCDRKESVLIREFSVPITKCINGISAGFGSKAMGSVKLTIRIQGAPINTEMTALTDWGDEDSRSPSAGTYATLNVTHMMRHACDLSTWWLCFDLNAQSMLITTPKRQSIFLSTDTSLQTGTLNLFL